MGGDFNLVQNIESDYYRYKHIGNQKAREVVLEMIEKFQLSDPWRSQHENEKRYTWFGPSSKKGRLDFFLVSSHLMNFLNKSDIDIGYRSDHAMVHFDIVFTNFEKGKGFWKFNNSLLKDKLYIDGVKDILLSLKQQYALIPFLPDAIKDMNNSEISFCIDFQLLFEQILLHIRGFTIEYSSRKKRKRIEREKQIDKELNTLASTVDICNNEQYILLQNELESIRKEYIKGLFVRTRAKWIEEGEKPTKYFLSLEKRNYINKTLTKIIDNNGITITNQMEILNEIKAYYRHFYDNKDSELHNVNLDLIINKSLVNTLDEEMREELEGEISYIEAVEALKNMKNDKSSGQDGFTSEFLKFFLEGHWLFLVKISE